MFYLAINPNEPIEIAYVPSHLYHVMFELFKVKMKWKISIERIVFI
jgi:hypothetical protein